MCCGVVLGRVMMQRDVLEEGVSGELGNVMGCLVFGRLCSAGCGMGGLWRQGNNTDWWGGTVSYAGLGRVMGCARLAGCVTKGLRRQRCLIG